MEIPAGTRRAVYEAAGACQRERATVALDSPLDGPVFIKAAYDAWLEWGQDKCVKLQFADNGLAVFDYVDD
jgi:hypothetical protein